MNSLEIVLSVFCILLIAYIIKLQHSTAKKNHRDLSYLIKGFIDHSSEVSKNSVAPVNLDESLVILFKNLKTTNHLFKIIAENKNPIQEPKLLQSFRQITTTQNQAVSEMAFKASVHLLMVSNLVDFDLKYGLKVTNIGRELFIKILN